MKIPQLNHDTTQYTLKITEWMNNISTEEEIHSDILRQKTNLYYNSSWPLFWDYMDISRSEWEEDKELSA